MYSDSQFVLAVICIPQVTCTCKLYIIPTLLYVLRNPKIFTGKDNTTKKPAKKEKVKAKKKPGTIITVSDHASPEVLASSPTPPSKDHPAPVHTNQPSHDEDQTLPSLKGLPGSSQPGSSATVAGLNVSFPSSTSSEVFDPPFSHLVKPDPKWYNEQQGVYRHGHQLQLS